MPTTTRRAATKKAAPAPAPEPEVEDLDVEDDELEDLDEAEVAETAPKKSKASDDVVFGASDLAALLSKGREKPLTTRDLRTLLRKMARDGRLDRVITPGNRTRYSWSGPNDPEVKAIIKAVKGGEIEQGKKEALDKLKADKAAKQAAKATKAAKANKAAAVEEDDDDE